MDRFSDQRDTVFTPPTRHELLVADPENDLPEMPKKVVCMSSAGFIKVRDAVGVELEYVLEFQQVLPIRPTRIMDIGGSEAEPDKFYAFY